MKLLRIDRCGKGNHGPSSAIDIGFAAEQALRRLKAAKKVTEKDCLSIRLDIKVCVISMVSKLQEKCPLNYFLLRNLGWLVPGQICSSGIDVGVAQLKRCLGVLTDSGLVQVSKCDDIICQYQTFVRNNVAADPFVPFSVKDRLDDLYFDTLAPRKEFAGLWEIVHVLLLLSNGQATVE